jgi:hypothetical protein
VALVAGSLLMELNWTYSVPFRFFQSALLHFNSFDWPIRGLTDWLTRFRFTVHAGIFLNVITSLPVTRSAYHPKQQVQEAFFTGSKAVIAWLYVKPEYPLSIIQPVNAVLRNNCIYCENHTETHCEAESRFSFVTSEKVVLLVLAMNIY